MIPSSQKDEVLISKNLTSSIAADSGVRRPVLAQSALIST